MDEKYLKDKKFLEAQKQFKRLCEWSYVPQTLEEEGEDDQMMDNSMPQDDGMEQNQMGGQNDGMGQDQMGGQDGNMPQDGNMVGQNDPNMPQDDQMMGDEQGMDNIMPPMDENMPPMDDTMNGEEEEVIDVDQLTDAQEKMNSKVNTVGQNLGDMNSKIESLINMLGNMEQMINNNNQEIEKFKAEFEKRNPTQTEKLNLRSLDSYPFNVSPKDYWAQKGEDPNSNYSGEADNQKSTTQEYQITNNDVDDFNEREMEKSFDITDDLQQDLKKIFGF